MSHAGYRERSKHFITLPSLCSMISVFIAMLPFPA